MPSKYDQALIDKLTKTLESVYVKQWGNLTATAQRYGLTRGQLQGIMSNYPAVHDAYKAGDETLVDMCVATFYRAATATIRGVNTQATGRILQAKRPDEWTPVQKVEQVNGYAKPGAEEEGSDAAGRLTLVNGGAPPAHDGTRD